MIPYTQAQFLKGKIAVVSGANRGIGQAICDSYLAHGAKVIACVREPQSMLTNPAYQSALADHTLSVVNLDLSDETSLKAASKTIRGISKQIDILVNNAGVASGGLFQMTSINDMKALFEVNLFNQIAFTQSIAKLMLRQRAGVIINISSSTAQTIDKGTLAYGTSKAAFERVTKSMALELADAGIRVNAIAPGVTATDMGQKMDPAARSQLVENSLIKAMATPQDIANSALFLASDLATHITGQVFHVDGGLTI